MVWMFVKGLKKIRLGWLESGRSGGRACCISFLSLLYQITHTVGKNDSHCIFLHFGGQMSKIVITDLKSVYQQGYVPSQDLRGELFSCLFQVQRLPAFLDLLFPLFFKTSNGQLSFSHSSSCWHSLFCLLLLLIYGPRDYTGSTQIIQDNLYLKVSWLATLIAPSTFIFLYCKTWCIHWVLS